MRKKPTKFSFFSPILPNTSPRVKLYKQMDHARVHTVIHVIYVCQYKNVDSHMLPF